MEENNFKDSISKNDLVDYVVTKRVTELNTQITSLQQERDRLSPIVRNEVIKLKEKYKKLEDKLVNKFVYDIYGSTIKLLEKNTNSKHSIVGFEKDHHSGESKDSLLSHIYSLQNGEFVIIFEPKISTKEPRLTAIRGGYCDGISYHPMPIMRGISSMIRVDASSMEKDGLLDIEDLIQEKEGQIKEIDKSISELRRQIQNIKDNKDLVKNKIIEESLSATEDGKKLLESISSIDFSIGPKLLK